MADLRLHAVQWCSQHGHPVLALRTSDDRFFIVAMSAEDAVALAAIPDTADSGRPSRRLHHLVESTVAALGARLIEVRLHVGRDDVLRASLQVQGPAGELALPAHFADGVALAHHGQLPLRMADEDLRRVPLTPLAAAEPPFPAMPAPGERPGTPASPPHPAPEAFRALIDSLDLDGFGHNQSGPGAIGPGPFA
jgi:bifunctional DNase/RNase